MDQNMVRLQRFELKVRLLGFQDTPDSAPMVPRPSEPKAGGCGERQLFDFTVFGAAGSNYFITEVGGMPRKRCTYDQGRPA